MVMRLISINIAAYVVLIALSAHDQETGSSVSKLLGVEGLKTLGAAWRTIGLVDRPLHLATHMFVHLDVRDLLGNAFILFLVGRIYQNEARRETVAEHLHRGRNCRICRLYASR